MKVLIVHTTYQYSGGEDTVVYEELKLLKSYGITVELLTFDNEKRALFKILQLPFNIFSYRKTKKKLELYKPDTVHVHNIHFGASPSVLVAIKKANIPFVTTLHNFRLICPSATLFYNGKLFLDSISRNFPWTAVVKGVYKNSVFITFWVSASYYLHRSLGTFKTCSRYIVLTEHAKKLFLRSSLQISPKQMVVKSNFCYDSSPYSSQTSDYFLFVGRLTEEKGIITLLKAFASANYKLKIAGDGPLKEEVEKYSYKNPNIEFIGKQDKERIFYLMQNCNALIFPSIWFEGMPLTIIEAFSCATPVIASNLGAMESMIKHKYNGLHFKPEDVNDLRDKLKDWQNLDQSQKEIYRHNARRTYEEFYTPSKNVDKLLDIYNAVIEESRRQVLVTP